MYPINEMDVIKLQVNGALDNILPLVRSISHILDEAYIDATTEFITPELANDFDDSDIFALALSQISRTAEFRVNQLNVTISELISEVTNEILNFVLNDVFAIKYQGEKSVDLSLRAIFAHHIVYILSTFIQIADDEIIYDVKIAARYIFDDVKACAIDLNILKDDGIFANNDVESLKNDLKKLSNILLIISGFSTNINYGIGELEGYLQAILTLNECVEVASISNRNVAYENMFSYNNLPF